MGSGVYGWSTGTGGVHWYRMAEPLRVAAEHGVNVGHGLVLDDAVAERFDTILVHMLWDERNSEAWHKLALNDQHRMVFDIDDAMWAPDWAPFVAHYTPEVLDRVYRNIMMAHVVTTPSPVIAEEISKINGNVFVCPNTVPEWVLSLDPPPLPYPATVAGLGVRHIVGYQGSPSHLDDFPESLHVDLMRFLDTAPAWGLHFWGPDEIPGWPPLRVGHTPWAASVPAYYRTLAMDVGIGPLKPGPFNDAKSSLRAVEYAALGIPCVLSDGPAYRGWVEDWVTGVLVAKPRDWYPVLSHLATDEQLRDRMRVAARLRAAAWTTEANIGTWVDAWNSA